MTLLYFGGYSAA